jgi:hypothetical protein
MPQSLVRIRGYYQAYACGTSGEQDSGRCRSGHVTSHKRLKLINPKILNVTIDATQVLLIRRVDESAC